MADENVGGASRGVPPPEQRVAGREGSAGAGATTATQSAAGLLPALTLPTGGGAIRGIGEKFSTNPATGTGSLSVPIATSAGRGGFQVALELRYESGNGNGPFGLGWQLSAPAVSRKTDKGLPRYDEANRESPDVFLLSGSEDLVPIPFVLPDGTQQDEGTATENGANYRIRRYRPRTEGPFARVERWTDVSTKDAHFRSYSRENLLSVYGRTPSARIVDPETPSHVFSWLLEETRDDRGNVARYTYKGEDATGVDAGKASEENRFFVKPDASQGFRATAQRYLKRIQYGNRSMVADRAKPLPAADDDYLFEIVFDYGEHVAPALASATEVAEPAATGSWPARQDAFSTYRAGFEVRTYRLCRRVLMFHRFSELGPGPCLVRSTDFEYDEGPVVTYLRAVTHAGYVRKRDGAGNLTGGYTRAFLPALEFSYSKPELHDELHVVDEASLRGLTSGVESAGAQWVDLDGEGISGLLLPSTRAWFYKANLGGGRLAPPASLRSLPAPGELTGGQQLTDLDGDGNLDLVSYAPPLTGYFERTPERGWAPFASLRDVPQIDWTDPNLRFLDIDGDGLPDVLITEDDAFVWYRSRGKQGFAPPAFVTKSRDESRGAAVVFADGSETVQLADMSGDGLVDIVRVRNGEVCYWPNLGYGRFGRRVTLDHSPRFDVPDRFDAKRVRFADIDGSGTSDIIYLGTAGVSVHANRAGNGLAPPVLLQALPPIHALAELGVVDLLGRGTACLVWSSTLTSERQLVYVDLMGGKKPHLLERIANNLGAETHIDYASSTEFYLRDKASGKPWLTRLPFPVQVVERVRRRDLVSSTELVTRFAYHHGYFDGYEREFRGFARVDQWDAESLGVVTGTGAELSLPPVRTTTWFHTGAWLNREPLEAALGREYYGQDPLAPVLPDTVLPPGLSIREERDAARALRGQLLRQEVYAEDGSPRAAHPYSVSERDYEVRLLHRATGPSPAVFFVHPLHTLDLNYERDPLDPRVQQEVVLETDAFGNVTQSATLGYPRRTAGEPEQQRLWVVHTARSFANRPNEATWHRVGVMLETISSELIGLTPPAQGVLSAEHLRAKVASAAPLAFETPPTPATEQRRVVARSRTVYYDDNLAQLPFGQIAARALAAESYRQAFSPGLLSQEYGGRVTPAMLTSEGRYVLQDGVWWAPSGRTVFDPGRFYLPVEAIDPFGQSYFVRYDAQDLLVYEVEDPLHNVVSARNDYRVLVPELLTDPNLNRVAVELDALGLVVKTAVMGKAGSGEGDTLADPTTKLEYDLLRWQRSAGAEPAFVHVLARETHGAGNQRWQESYAYSDGFGREVMKKIQAEPGEVPMFDAAGRLLRNPDGSPQTRRVNARWVGSGRTVFDNKGNPVKKYEPFFSDSSDYESEQELVEWGVTPIFRYDPLGRLTRVDQPDGTQVRVVLEAWRRQTWDENDNVAGTPWLARKQAGSPREQRCAALALAHASTPAVAHLDALGRVFLNVADNGPAGTRATRLELDVLGNQRSVTDARGNLVVRQIFDFMSRPLRTVRADAGAWDSVNGRRAAAVQTDPDGTRALLDAASKPVRTWLERDISVRRLYDPLRRPTQLFVREGGGVEQLLELTIYGEALPAAAGRARNLRTRVCQSYDGAGRLEHVQLDFKGNPVRVERRLTRSAPAGGAAAGWEPYRPDWQSLVGLGSVAAIELAANPLLDTAHPVTSTYDAMNRLVLRATPDGSRTRFVYNEANLLEKVEVQLRGAVDGSGNPSFTPFVSSVDYNARGQRLQIEYGAAAAAASGAAVATSYTYDERTFRLARQRTVRRSDGAVLQDLGYERDPVGNVVQIVDRVSFGRGANAPMVDPEASVLQRLLAGYGDSAFEYDALYQLVEARGRHHAGQQPDERDLASSGFAHPNDAQGLEGYRENYDYDAVGNLRSLVQRPLSGAAAGWTRHYRYAPDSNRLLATSAAADPAGTLSASYEHDEAGNMKRMPHLPELNWDYANRLRTVKKQLQAPGAPVNDLYFAYDASGERVRKIYAHGGLLEERIYLGGYEIYRRWDGGAAPALERHTLHVLDGERRVALVETKTVDASVAGFTPVTRQRFQVDSYLGASTMELDQVGAVIGYEDYYPFGGTAFRAAGAATDVSEKRYRYTGKERDEETGLYYYGARYYAAWLGRWTSCDQGRDAARGRNLYRYCANDPINAHDPDGRDVVVLKESQISAKQLVAMIKAQADIPQQIRDGISVSKTNPDAIVFQKGLKGGRMPKEELAKWDNWTKLYMEAEVAARGQDFAFTTGVLQVGPGSADIRQGSFTSADVPRDTLGQVVMGNFDAKKTGLIPSSASHIAGVTLPSVDEAARLKNEKRESGGGTVVSNDLASGRSLLVAVNRVGVLDKNAGPPEPIADSEVVRVFFHELALHGGGMAQEGVGIGHGTPRVDDLEAKLEKVLPTNTGIWVDAMLKVKAAHDAKAAPVKPPAPPPQKPQQLQP